MKSITTILIILFITIFSFGTIQAQSQPSFTLNSSYLHILTSPVATGSFDQELIVGYNPLAIFGAEASPWSNIAPSVSFEYNYSALAGETVNILFVNANLGYNFNNFFIKNVFPYVGASYSFARVTNPSSNGHGWTLLAGFIIPISNQTSMFTQYKRFHFTNDFDIGKSSLQTGISYTF